MVVAMRRILLVKLSSLGDILHTLPVLADLRRAFPASEIDWALEPAFAALPQLAGADATLPCPLRACKGQWFSAATRARLGAMRQTLRQQSYDAVIDLQGLLKSALVARLAPLNHGGARFGLGNRTEGSSYEWLARLLYHRAITLPPQIHAVERARLLCAHALGYQCEGAPDFGLSALRSRALAERANSEPREVVCIFAASRAEKEWPLPHWQRVIAQLRAEGWRVSLAHGNAREKRLPMTLPSAAARKSGRV